MLCRTDTPTHIYTTFIPALELCASWGADVYVAGLERGFARYWKNGVGTNLNVVTNVGFASSVFVLGTDVFVAGSEITNIINNLGFEYPRLWINGINSALSFPSGYTGGVANSVYVVGADVYVSGYLYSNNLSKAVYWKNGVVNILNNLQGSSAESSSIFVYNNDVYNAGFLKESAANLERAVYWKNGIRTYLSTNVSSANSIFISNNDVYITGSENIGGGGNNVAKYWKNGVGTNLTPGSTSDNFGEFIFVKNNNVYISGNEVIGNDLNSRVWKNGLVTNFFNISNDIEVGSIFVK